MQIAIDLGDTANVFRGLGRWARGWWRATARAASWRDNTAGVRCSGHLRLTAAQRPRYGCSVSWIYVLSDRQMSVPTRRTGPIPGLLQVLSRDGGKRPAVPVPK